MGAAASECDPAQTPHTGSQSDYGGSQGDESTDPNVGTPSSASCCPAGETWSNPSLCGVGGGINGGISSSVAYVVVSSVCGVDGGGFGDSGDCDIGDQKSRFHGLRGGSGVDVGSAEFDGYLRANVHPNTDALDVIPDSTAPRLIPPVQDSMQPEEVSLVAHAGFASAGGHGRSEGGAGVGGGGPVVGAICPRVHYGQAVRKEGEGGEGGGGGSGGGGRDRKRAAVRRRRRLSADDVILPRSSPRMVRETSPRDIAHTSFGSQGPSEFSRALSDLAKRARIAASTAHAAAAAAGADGSGSERLEGDCCDGGSGVVRAPATATAAAAAASHWTGDASSARPSQSAEAMSSHWTGDASLTRPSQSAAADVASQTADATGSTRDLALLTKTEELSRIFSGAFPIDGLANVGLGGEGGDEERGDLSLVSTRQLSAPQPISRGGDGGQDRSGGLHHERTVCGDDSLSELALRVMRLEKTCDVLTSAMHALPEVPEDVDGVGRVAGRFPAYLRSALCTVTAAAMALGVTLVSLCLMEGDTFDGRLSTIYWRVDAFAGALLAGFRHVVFRQHVLILVPT